MKRITQAGTALLVACSLLLSCTGGDSKPPLQSEVGETAAASSPPTQSSALIEDVQLGPIKADAVAAGKSIYEMKCQSCHKLTDEKLVGPGWKGITQRRKAGWIVAMITNPEEMLNNDTEAKKLLEEMLVKMPNQNLTKGEALQVVDFMRTNDGEK